MLANRTLVLFLALGSLVTDPAEAQDGPSALPVVAGDSVRIWSRPPEAFAGYPARVARFTTDSLALSSGTVLHLSSVIQLQVGRRVKVRGGGGHIAGGAIGGLVIGALAGGAIGSQSGEGMGALVGIPAGAFVGALAGGFFGARERTVTQWVPVPLGGH